MDDRFDIGSGRKQAEDTYREHYAPQKNPIEARVRRALEARKMELASTDLEEAYARAWETVYLMIAKGEVIENLGGMLYRVTLRRAVDLYRKLHASSRAPVDIDTLPVEADLDVLLDDQIKLERFLQVLGGELTDRQCMAFILVFLHGYSRPEAAEILGLKRKQIEKLMDRATRKVARVVALVDTRGCGDDEWTRLIRAYALGSIGEEDRDYARVESHLAECQSCQRYANVLRGMDAALVPPIWLLPASSAGGLLGVLHGAGRTLRRLTGWSRTGGIGFGNSVSTGALAKGTATAVAVAVTVGVVSHRHSHHAHPRASSATTPRQAATPQATSDPEDATEPAGIPASTLTGSPDPARHKHGKRHHKRARKTVAASATSSVTTTSPPKSTSSVTTPSAPKSTSSGPADQPAAVSPTKPAPSSASSSAPTRSSKHISASEAAEEEFTFERR